MIFLRRAIRDFFGFSRAQINAFLILLPMMLMLLFSQPLYRTFFTQDKRNFIDRHKLDSLVAVFEEASAPIIRKSIPHTFAFDPNVVSVQEMDSLGFSRHLSTRIARYREKGGKFRVKRDLLKIYGVDTTFYQALYPYIQLPEQTEKTFSKPAKTVAVKEQREKRSDLNLADTAQLKEVYGIGEKLSLRIIRYREALGGFTGSHQVSEVYGLDSTVVKRLMKRFYIDEKFQIRRMNINQLSEKDLSAHPYLSLSAAKAIVSYRFQHGNFREVDDLRKIPVLNEETIRKITPYLEFN